MAKPGEEAGAGSGPDLRSESVGCLGNLPTVHSKVRILKQGPSRAPRLSAATFRHHATW